MRTKCAASCRQCTGGDTTGGDTGDGTTGGATCRNKDIDCEAWARRGECTRNPYYMRPNCCASCQGR